MRCKKNSRLPISRYVTLILLHFLLSFPTRTRTRLARTWHAFLLSTPEPLSLSLQARNTSLWPEKLDLLKQNYPATSESSATSKATLSRTCRSYLHDHPTSCHKGTIRKNAWSNSQLYTKATSYSPKKRNFFTTS